MPTFLVSVYAIPERYAHVRDLAMSIICSDPESVDRFFTIEDTADTFYEREILDVSDLDIDELVRILPDPVYLIMVISSES